MVFRLVIRQNSVEDSAMPNIQTVTVTFHINEDTGSIVNATRYDGRPGEARVPQGTITDCQALVVSRNSPYCVNIKIDGVWYCL
jgi:hypothetical protein